MTSLFQLLWEPLPDPLPPPAPLRSRVLRTLATTAEPGQGQVELRVRRGAAQAVVRAAYLAAVAEQDTARRPPDPFTQAWHEHLAAMLVAHVPDGRARSGGGALVADDTPARPEGSPATPAPVTVPVSPAAGDKLAAVADRIVGIRREQRDGPGLLQIVFHDPVPDDGDPHDELREHLVARGIPRSAIRLTREADRPAEDYRNDTVSVVITSTDGTDIAAAAAQGRDIAVHHLDLPRSYPVAQRRAQAVSATTSGNSANLVFRYITTGTPDSLRWEALDRKQAFIAQALARPPDIPVDEGPSDSRMSYNELKALASGGAGLIAGDLLAQGAVIAEILTEDGDITLPAGPGADVPVAAARHLVDLVNGRVQPAGTPRFNSAAGTLTVPVPGGTVSISAQNVTGRALGGDPLACLARALQSAGVPASVQLSRSPHARLWGVGTNIRERLSALEHPHASPFRPDYLARGRPVGRASRLPANRLVPPPRPPGR